MSNGYLIAAAADLAAAHDIAEGFGLDVIDASSVHDRRTTATALASAANVGVLLSTEAAQNEDFVALLRDLAAQRQSVQLILVSADARAAFAFLPASWPVLSLEEARARSSELLRRRQAETPPPQDAPRAEPLPPTSESEAPLEQGDPAPPEDLSGGADAATSPPGPSQEEPSPQISAEAPQAEAPAPPPSAAEPAVPPPSVTAPDVTDLGRVAHQTTPAQRSAAPTAPADATAFAPSKLRRGTPELVRIVVHQPKDLNAVIKAAKKLDPRTEPAPQGMNIGDVALGASIGVALEVRGGACDGGLQRRTWLGEPIDFNFAVEADATVKQVVMLARVFIDDAQIGVLAFTRKVAGPAKKPHGLGDRARLKRHKRVFLSYSSKDRETVAAIATAYQKAGVDHFWDRTSLKSGEEWSPRLRREIDRADLFHLCWSKAAAQSEWVAKEAEHALTRRRKNSGKPEITVQMLDGPPWAPHPPSLVAINFDDFVRAAIVGYARGDGCPAPKR